MNRFQMTREENVFLAKRLLVDSIYKQARLEGIAVTFANTIDILNNVNAADVAPNDINKVCCLRDAWNYLLDHLDDQVDLAFIETLHELVARFDVPYSWLGRFRQDTVMISGTTWRPTLPDQEAMHQTFLELSAIEDDTERALRTGLWLMRQQPFLDGNKRVGSFVINKVLIQNGRGLFNVPVELDAVFKKKLVDYYISGDFHDVVKWCEKNTLEGQPPLQEEAVTEEPKSLFTEVISEHDTDSLNEAIKAAAEEAVAAEKGSVPDRPSLVGILSEKKEEVSSVHIKNPPTRSNEGIG